MYLLVKNPNVPLSAFAQKKSYHWFVVATVCVGAFMAALDASIINIALPAMQKGFHLQLHEVEWVSLVYLLTLASLIIPFGRMADMYGRRWMYTGGFVVFLFGSLMCGLTGAFVPLLLWRVIQAVGAAMLQANSVSIITAITPTSDRGKAIGIQSSAQGVGLTLGPALGGLILTHLDWRWLFLINVPIGIIGVLLAILLLPKDQARTKPGKFDYWGMLFLCPCLILLVYVLNMGQNNGWASPFTLLALFTSAVGFIAFIREESCNSHPLVDLSLFANPSFRLGSLTGLLSYTVMYGILLLAPFFIDQFLILSKWGAGIFMTVIPLGMTLCTPFSGSIADRFGIRAPTILGMSLILIGCFVLAFLTEPDGMAFFITGLGLVGVGMGMFTPPNNSSVMGSAPSDRLGVAGGILNMARTVGMGVGVTFGGMVFQAFTSWGNRKPAFGPMPLNAFHAAFLMIGAVALAALFISIFRNQTDRPNADYFIGDGI